MLKNKIYGIVTNKTAIIIAIVLIISSSHGAGA